MRHFQTATAESNRVQGPVKGHAAVNHADVDVVPVGRELDTKVGRRQRKVGANVGDLVRPRKLRVHHRARVQDVCVTQGAADRVAVTPVARGMYVVRRRVERLIAVACERAEQQAVLGVGYVIQPADGLEPVFRLSDRVTDEAFGVRRR